MKNICFSGHRKVCNTDDVKKLLKSKLEMLIENGADNFYAGGALGWDMLCEKTIIELKKVYKHIKLHLILPCPIDIQTLKWTEYYKREYRQICESADSIVVLSDKYYDGCMKKRNQALVDKADCCVCYYNLRKSASGTGQTVRMAVKKNIEIINIFNEK